MSRKHGTLDFTGGMNNVNPVHLLKDNEAEEIRNLYLDADGVWKDINNPEVMLDLSESHLELAIKVIQWKPTKVPIDCIDDFVYVVFCSDGVAKLVYRGTGEMQVLAIDIKARLHGTTSYRAVTITGVTTDLDGNGNGTTSTSPSGALTRRYMENTVVAMTAPVNAGASEEFMQWIDGDTGDTLTTSRALSLALTKARLVIAEYVGVPYIRVEDSAGTPIYTLGEFGAEIGEYSEVKSYWTGGISLIAPLKIYPPEAFEISLDQTTWVENPNYIEIAAATANAGMTRIYVRYFGTEE